MHRYGEESAKQIPKENSFQNRPRHPAMTFKRKKPVSHWNNNQTLLDAKQTAPKENKLWYISSSVIHLPPSTQLPHLVSDMPSSNSGLLHSQKFRYCKIFSISALSGLLLCFRTQIDRMIINRFRHIRIWLQLWKKLATEAELLIIDKNLQILVDYICCYLTLPHALVGSPEPNASPTFLLLKCTLH